MFKKKKIKFFLHEHKNLAIEIKKGLLECGKYSYGEPKIYRWGNQNKLKIGNFCSFGPNIEIFMGGDHRFDFITTSPLGAHTFNNSFPSAPSDFLLDRGDLIIENDVWIGSGTKIFSGITISTGAIIGAGSVIRKSIEPYSIVYGNPAIEVGKRFDEITIKKILETEWWNLDDKKIDILSKHLLSPNIEKFFDEFEKISK